MFAYCLNNPVRYVDYNGERIVGIGFTVDVTAGNATYGVEIVVYFDPKVVSSTSSNSEKNYSIAYYSYSGVSFSTNDLLENSAINTDISMIVGLLSTGEFDKTIEDWNLGITTADEFLLSIIGLLSQSGEFSGGIFLIDGNDSFETPLSYSGGFDSYSVTVKKPGAHLGATGYVSTSKTCVVYGAKATRSSGICIWPVAVSYSKTYYSKPTMLC